MSRRTLTIQECQYIQHELGVDNPRRQKIVLQRLCASYGRGFGMPAGSVYALQQSLGGLITAQGTHPKVRRWALNAVALIGTPQGALNAVTYALDHFQDDPEIFASSISALIRLDPTKFHGIASSANFSRELVLLSGLRTAGPNKVDVRDLRINIEVAEPETLKLALLTVGLNRAPSYMFHPSHENRDIVKILGRHDQAIVSQYSVWAIAENANFGIADLGVPTNDMEALRPNVRGWVYRLHAEDRTDNALRHDMVVQGSLDAEPDVRLSLATGLKDTFYDGLEGIVTNWYDDETDVEVRSQLLDHMVRHALSYPGYAAIVTKLYAQEPPNSRMRQRMEATAAGTDLFGDFQRIAIQSSMPLFNNYGEVNLTMTTNNEYNVGSIVAGAVALGGDATNSGNVQNNLTEAQKAEARVALDTISNGALGLPAPELSQKALASAINEAKAEPTKERLGNVANALKKIEEGLGSVANAGGHVTTIAGYLALLATFL